MNAVETAATDTVKATKQGCAVASLYIADAVKATEQGCAVVLFTGDSVVAAAHEEQWHRISAWAVARRHRMRGMAEANGWKR